jgi:hypothetical protein
MTIEKYISDQNKDDAKLLAVLHNIILSKDESVSASIGKMMGSEMIIYNDCGMFKYGLAKVKKYLSLHLLPMYCSPEIYERYKKILPGAKFQKGCINFTNENELPPSTVSKLISDCSKVDMTAIKNKVQKSKK